MFSVFFLLVLAGALWWLYVINGALPQSIPVFDAILLALASLRLTRLIVYDKITLWFRALFARGEGPVAVMRDLLSCPWCVGFWAALAVCTAYFAFTWSWFVILFLAVAGAGSLLQITANALGWQAEHLKQSAGRNSI